MSTLLVKAPCKNHFNELGLEPKFWQEEEKTFRVDSYIHPKSLREVDFSGKAKEIRA